MIRDILKNFKDKKILVVGDVMLDHYIIGKVNRISPEAPVPVVEQAQELYRLGGAANVALNLKSLGANPLLVGITGNDDVAKIMQAQLAERELSIAGLFCDCGRSSTLKTRIGTSNQQIVRLDNESKHEIDDALAQKIISFIESTLPDCEAVIIEDYNKGLLSKTLIDAIINLSSQHNKIVCVDPKHKHFFDYRDVTVFKPNFSEMQHNLGILLENDEIFFDQAFLLKAKLRAHALVVTRGAKGLYVFTDTEIPTHIPTFAKEVFDVSGAGDTVISVLCLALASSADLFTAATIANHAAGVVCGKPGTATVSIDEILMSYENNREN